MRLLTVISIILLLPCTLFADENSGYLVRLEKGALAQVKSLSHNRTVCVEEQCYLVANSEEDAQKFISYGLASSYEPDVMRYLANTNDLLFNEQWALNSSEIGWLHAKELVSSVLQSSDMDDSPIVAILDTGYMPHEDTNEVIYKWFGINNITDSDQTDLVDYNGHGTHVAGIIAAQNDNTVGIAGSGFGKVRIMPIKAYIDELEGFQTSDLIAAIDIVIKEKKAGANIVAVNMSYGGGSYSSAEHDAMQRLHNAGIIAVAAAGNDGSTYMHYPSGYDVPTIISVGALADNLELASYSNRGSFVDIAAPGSTILSLSLGRNDLLNSGTAISPNPDDTYVWALDSGTQELIFDNNTTTKFNKSKNYVRVDHSKADIAAMTGNKMMAVKYALECESNCSIVLESAYLNSGGTRTIIYKTVYYTLTTDTGTKKTRDGYLYVPLPERDCWTILYMVVANASKAKPLANVSLHNKVSFDLSNTYVKYSGTSMAAPFVSGVIAGGKAVNPEIQASALVELLYCTADTPSNLDNIIIGSRRINVGRFINSVEAGTRSSSSGGGGCSLTGVSGGLTDAFALLIIPASISIRRKLKTAA